MAASPYDDLPARAFWRTAVANEAGPPKDVYRPRFPITSATRLFTAGSCFAQHLGRRLREADFAVIDEERAPRPVSDETARRFGFRLFSARFGNIYTIRQFLQLVREAKGSFQPHDAIWRKGDRYVDALRPGAEPDGLPDAASVRAHRERHLQSVLRGLKRADVVVFTLGLTEAWTHREDGLVYPSAPGVIAGRYDPAIHEFRSFDAVEAFQDFEALRSELRELNPEMRFLLTVSPVPMTATAGGEHALVANCGMKSTLRAVAATAFARFEDVDYFPSFELLTNPVSRDDFYAENRRDVSAEGVALVMERFFAAHGVDGGGDEAATRAPQTQAQDVICEEELLDAFADRRA